MSDEEALKLGRELAELSGVDLEIFMNEAEILISLGHIAVKLAEPFVLEKLREPREGMNEAARRAVSGYPSPNTMRAVWQAMIDARLAELKP